MFQNLEHFKGLLKNQKMICHDETWSKNPMQHLTVDPFHTLCPLSDVDEEGLKKEVYTCHVRKINIKVSMVGGRTNEGVTKHSLFFVCSDEIHPSFRHCNLPSMPILDCKSTALRSHHHLALQHHLHLRRHRPHRHLHLALRRHPRRSLHCSCYSPSQQ